MYLRHLYPVPRFFSEDESRRFVFGSRVSAVVSGMSPEGVRRTKELWRRFCCDASELQVTPGGEGCRLTVGAADCRLAEGDRYSLHAGGEGVCVAAADPSALMDGVKTLVQLICPSALAEGRESFYISAADVHDAPAVAFRAIHFCVFPDSRLCTVNAKMDLSHIW